MMSLKEGQMFVSIISFGFSHPWMPTILYLSLGSWVTALSLYFHPRLSWNVVLWILAGIFVWTFIEYFLHRFVFHFQSMKEPWKHLIAEAHLEHHRTARTGQQILVRPLFSLITALFVYFLLALVTMSWSLAALLETGVFLGFIAYEWIHFAAHRYHPSSRLGIFLKQYHLHHHFKEADRAFGVTTPFWDWVWGTRPL